MADTPASGLLPKEIIESVAISNLVSIGMQPGMMANMNYSNLLTNNNMAMLNGLTSQQSLFQSNLVGLGKLFKMADNTELLQAMLVTGQKQQ